MVTDAYRAYLLRLWRVENDGSHWRARLENVETGETQGFASLGMLIEFLRGLGEEWAAPGTMDGENKAGS
jgi:hypothetical protein